PKGKNNALFVTRLRGHVCLMGHTVCICVCVYVCVCVCACICVCVCVCAHMTEHVPFLPFPVFLRNSTSFDNQSICVLCVRVCVCACVCSVCVHLRLCM